MEAWDNVIEKLKRAAEAQITPESKAVWTRAYERFVAARTGAVQ